MYFPLIYFFRKQKWVCSQEIQARDGRKERETRKEAKAWNSICGVKKGWEEKNIHAEYKALKCVHI